MANCDTRYVRSTRSSSPSPCFQILDLQRARRAAEEEAEAVARARKVAEDRTRQEMKGQIEMEQERRRQREEMRLVRQQEAQERSVAGLPNLLQ